MLDNTTKLNDIISALQGIEGINAKADLASVVGTPATANDTMAAINAVIQQAKNDLAIKMGDGSSGAEPLQALIDKLFVGKKWASGSGISSSTTLNFRVSTASGWSTGAHYYVEILGLDFVPSVIITTTSDMSFESSLYYSNGFFRHVGELVKVGYIGSGSKFSDTQGALSVTPNKTVLPLGYPSKSFNWIAIE